MSSADRQFVEDCLEAINNYRSIHQVQPLSYNDEIAQVAQNWAQQNVFGHNPKAYFHGKQMGENIASGSGGVTTGAGVAELWYSEIQDWDFGASRGRGVTGHFTQLVWKDSKEIGIGRTQTRDGKWTVVANFFPPGNFNNDYANNVFPPKDGKLPPLTKKDHKFTDPQKLPATRNTETSTQRSTVNGVTTTTTITTETTTVDGVKKVKVTEEVERPGEEKKVNVRVTTTNPDGSTSEKTLTEEERSSPDTEDFPSHPVGEKSASKHGTYHADYKDPQKLPATLSTTKSTKKSTVNGVATTTTTETTTDVAGVKKVKVTEKVERPGQTTVKITLTTTNPDGSTSEETSTEEEYSR